ncbi:gelsolin-related protein of 125 kDa-like [Periplaneta americana]|uniref:gelsolin-related protein of 125 kDa-like n=1 Tax=Periplaneta americana TaxID=6978 RepID=UPI0037E76C94
MICDFNCDQRCERFRVLAGPPQRSKTTLYTGNKRSVREKRENKVMQGEQGEYRENKGIQRQQEEYDKCKDSTRKKQRKQLEDKENKGIRIQLEPLQNELDCDAEYNGEIMNQNNQVIDTTEVEEIVDLPVIVRANESIAEVTTEEEELIREELTEAEIRGEINESGSSSGVPPFGSSACTTKKKTTGSKRGYSQIQELAAQSTSLCEIEKEFLIKKYRKEEQLLDIKIENAQLKQQLLKKQLEK